MGMACSLSADGRIILKRILKEPGVSLWFEFIWLSTETSGGMLLTPYESPNFLTSCSMEDNTSR
jgi:hypothetical protein